MAYTEIIQEFATGITIDIIRYFVFAGTPFVILYVLFRSKLVRYKIQQKFPENKHIVREIGFSLLSMTIFGVFSVMVFILQQHGYTKIYTDIHDHSMGYFVFSILVFIVAHDTYFYWGHRLMHHKKIYPHVHLIHHKSFNPTPWATFSFHPIEAVMQVLILPIMVFAIPLHPYAILTWSIYQLMLNVGGHTGYEPFRSGFTKRIHTFWHNTATHHNMHHKHVNCNYSLYFNIWDRIMGTNHVRYHEEFEGVIKRRQEEGETVKDKSEQMAPERIQPETFPTN